MKEVLPILLVLSLALSSSSPLFPVGGRAVVIRIDDIQDYGGPSPYATPEKTLLQYQIEHKIPSLLAVIPTRFGGDPQLIDQVKQGVERGIFDVAIHGWHHESFTNLSRGAQLTEIQYGKNKLESILSTGVLAFVPPYNVFNKDTVYALKTSGLTLMSASVYVGDIPREEDGVAYLPQTVTTAVVEQNDTWGEVPLESVTQEIKGSWDSYGVAVVVIHPRQFAGTDSEHRWQTYFKMIEWITANQGSIIRFEPPSPQTKNAATTMQTDPFMISVGIFAGLTSTLLIAFNMSAGRSSRRSLRAASKSLMTTDAMHSTLPSSGFAQLSAFTKITILCAAIASLSIAVLWWFSGKTYLDLGLSWLGFAYFGVGLFEGKIFYSSIITFIAAFALAVFILAERQSVHPIKAIIVSWLVILSGAYLFEYVYLFLNHQVLFKYLGQFHWWFNLGAGFLVGFGFKFMRVTKRAVILFSVFALSMALWYLSGYPQLADKETPVLLYHNYLGISVEYAFPLNALSKLLACVAVVGLLRLEARSPSVAGVRADEDGKAETLSERAPESLVKRLASVLREKKAPASIRQAMIGTDSTVSQSSTKLQMLEPRQSFPSWVPPPAMCCRRCGRKIARSDRYCDVCGLVQAGGSPTIEHTQDRS